MDLVGPSVRLVISDIFPSWYDFTVKGNQTQMSLKLKAQLKSVTNGIYDVSQIRSNRSLGFISAGLVTGPLNFHALTGSEWSH